MLVVRSDDHRAHHSLELDGGRLIPSWEGRDRAERVESALAERGYRRTRHALPVSAEILASVHSPAYLEFLVTCWSRWVETHDGPVAMGFAWPARGFRSRRPDDLEGQLGFHSFAADCSITEHTWLAARASASVAATAARAVVDGEPSAFALCRPPGHHATADQFGGYCYLNNAAVAVEVLRRGGADRVGVLDIDYHHGNGTQSIFYHRADVPVVSIHADPVRAFPWFSGYDDELGAGAGEGWNRNFPLPDGTGADRWLDVLELALVALDGAELDALVVSTGVDTYEGDPISHFRLQSDDFFRVGAAIATAQVPTVFVLEGGYATEQLGTNVVNILDGFGDRQS